MRINQLSILIGVFLLIGCGLAADRDNRNSNSEVSFEDIDEDFEPGEFIDIYAGHPYDKDLPEDIFGVTDEEIQETDPIDINALLTDGAVYARENMQEPRYLFAVGRVGYFFDHDSAKYWLLDAARAGSNAAKAYLGYLFFDEGDLENSITLLNGSIEGGFEDPNVPSLLSLAKKNQFDPNKFNKPDLIKALYEGNTTHLRKYWFLSKFYIGAIQSSLWSSEVLFLVENTDIVLELDPGITVRETSLVENGMTTSIKQTIQAGSAILGFRIEEFKIIEQGIQDGRRLALLYDNNPVAFRRVYKGMIKYSEGQ